jgi:urate oxidase
VKDEPGQRALAALASHSYGKSGIRFLIRDGGSVQDRSLDLDVRGDFAPAFLEGDNSTTLPTDSMRNHALVLADEMPAAEAEVYGEHLVRRLLDAIPVASGVALALTLRPWIQTGHQALTPGGWIGRATVDLARVDAEAGAPATITGGLEDLQVLVPSGSGFSGFLRDALTEQSDESDRVLAGRVDAAWRYGTGTVPYAGVRERVGASLLAAVGDGPSPGVQRTVYLMGCAALEAAPELSDITVSFTARPHRPAGGIGGRPASTAVWVVGEAPAGVTRATVRRR